MSQLHSILSHVGEFGPFQRRVYILLNVLTIFRCCQMFLLVFVADKPQWSCLDAGGVLNNEAQCLMNGSTCEHVKFSDGFTSVTSEWRLICDQEYKRNLANAIVMAGCLLGAVLFGGMADTRGRKSTIILTYSFASVFCLASGFAQSYEMFVLLRFGAAVMLNGSSTAVYVLISEIVGQKSKDMLLTAYQTFYSVGYVLLSLSAYFIRDWRYLTIVVSSPMIYCSLFLLHNGICESPHWLVENKRIEESKSLIKEIAKKNKADISDTILEKLTDDIPKASLKNFKSNSSIVSKPGDLQKVVTLSVIWLFLAMMYMGLSFLSGNLSSNKYLSVSFCGLVEVPAVFLSMWLIKTGRKMPLISLALFGSFACLVCAWLQGAEKSELVSVLITILALLGKFGVAACYNIISIFSSEHFGVAVRSFAMGIFSTASSIGGILAPLVIGLEAYEKRIPMVSFGLGALFSAGLVLTLPETVQKVQKDKLGEKEE